MILGEVLSKIGKKPLATLLQNKVLGPLGLRNTVESETSEIPAPFLHTFSAERRNYFDVPPTTPFYEEETFWNTQWGTPIGANQVSDDRRHDQDRRSPSAAASSCRRRATTP